MDGTFYLGPGIELHSFDTWGLLKYKPTVVSPPVKKSAFVDIPGANGAIDLMKSLAAQPVYKNRTVTDVFLAQGTAGERQRLLSALYKALDGGEYWIVVDGDTDHCFFGVPMVAAVEEHLRYTLITVAAEVEPFRYERYSSLEDMLWDDINFETTIIRDYKDIAVDGELLLSIPGTKMPVTPEFILDIKDTGNLEVQLDGGKFYALSYSHNIFHDLIIDSGEHTLRFRGSGTVSVDYRGGDL